MKIIFRFTGFCLCMLILSKDLNAQKDILYTEIKVSIQKGSLKEIFENVEANNNLIVSYSSSIVDISSPIVLDTTDYLCSDLFMILLEQQPVRAISRGFKILIIPDPSKDVENLKLKPRNYYTINGYVKDSETGEALIGASVYNPLTNRGTISNEFGYYSFTMPEGNQTVNYSFVGYTAVSKTYDLDEKFRSDIFLDANIEFEEIIVIDRDSSQIWRGREKINIDEIRNLPSILGEVDVLKAIALLPGIQSGNEAQGGLLVRGGSPDQNLILVDGMPLYEVNHLLGLVSIFNEDVINNVNVYKSDFSAKYGGRLSSVVDIQLKDGNYKNFHGSATAGALGGKINLEGPIQEEKSSFNIAGRTSWLGQLIGPRVNDILDIDGTKFNYYDFNVKIKREFASTNSLTFSAYLGRDDIAYSDKTQNIGSNNLETDNKLSWGNEIASLRWSRLLGPKVFSNLTIGFVNYNYLYHVQHTLENTNTLKENIFTVASTSRIFDRMAKLDFDYYTSNRLDIKFGAGYILHTYNPAVKQASQALDNNIKDIFGGIIPTNAGEYILYGESYFRPLSNISIHTGVHYAIYTVGDEIYNELQPRISFNYGLPWNAYVGASYSRMNQFIHLLGNPGLGLPSDLWVPSTSTLAPELSDQFTFSYSSDLTSSINLSTAVYYKTFENLLEFRSAYDLFSPVINDINQIPLFNEPRDWESRVDVGAGNAYGVELQLKKREGSLHGNISYTYGRSFRTFDNINRSVPFPYRYDRKHDVSVSLIQDLGQYFSLGIIWVYGTGTAFTLPLEEYFSINGEIILDYEARNNQRLPEYHRLDASVNYNKLFNKFGISVSLGAYNAYSRKNPYYVYLFQNPETEAYRLRQVSIFPVLPYLNVKFKL